MIDFLSLFLFENFIHPKHFQETQPSLSLFLSRWIIPTRRNIIYEHKYKTKEIKNWVMTFLPNSRIRIAYFFLFFFQFLTSRDKHPCQPLLSLIGFSTYCFTVWETGLVAMQTVTREFMSNSSYLLTHIRFLFLFYIFIYFLHFCLCDVLWRLLFKLSTCTGYIQAIIWKGAFLNLIMQQIPVLVPGYITVIPSSNCRQLTSYA